MAGIASVTAAKLGLVEVGTKDKVTSATKFRVACRVAGVTNGWKLVQITSGTDQYTKEGTVVHIHHGPSDLVTSAEMLVGEELTTITSKDKLKVERAHNWLVPADQATQFLKVAKDLVTKYESGKGVAAIKVFAPKDDQAS